MAHFFKKAGAGMLVAVGSLIVGAANIQAASPIWAPPPLAALIEEGLTQNNEIKSMEDRVKSLKQEVPFAGSLDDPRIGLGALNVPTNSFSFDQEPMTQKQIFIAQKIPWFGKLSLKSQRPALKAVREEALLEAKRLELARRIADSYYELGFNSYSLEINSRLTDLVGQLLSVAETRYATGRGLQQDVLQAQVELSKLLDEKITLEKTHRALEDQLNELMNRENFQPVSALEELRFPDLNPDAQALESRALRDNPWLQVRMAEIDLADIEVELAHKDYWPDMDFMVAYGQREHDYTGRDLPDFVSGSVVMTVPLWYKYRQDPKLAADLTARGAAEKLYRNLIQTLPHRVDALVTEVRDMQKNYKLFNDALILQAEQWAQSSLAAYEVGSLEFNTMIKAQIDVLRFDLQQRNYLFRIYQKRAELEEVLGGAL
jgi:cobalt-zinc-cadmium efflux system outer membrane protein